MMFKKLKCNNLVKYVCSVSFFLPLLNECSETLMYGFFFVTLLSENFITKK